jgi:PAS domain S-box-containing protein
MSLRKTDQDLYSVLAASRAIQGEIELQPLLSELMSVIAKNADAQWGVIVLKHDSGLVIEAHLTDQASVVLEAEPVAGNAMGVPESVVRHVALNQEPVVLEDAASTGPFAQDPTIQRRRPLWVLCLPIVRKSELVGVFYLENNLARHAFTEDHLDVLQWLSAQAAQSIENAKLYADLNESEKKYRVLMDAMPDGVLVHAEGIIRFVNNTCVQMLGGKTADDIIGRNAMSFIHEDYRGLAAERIGKVYAGGALGAVEYKIVQLGGRVIDVDMAAAAVEYQGRPASQVVIRDITDKKLAERQLMRAEKMASLGQIIAGVAHEINNPNNLVYFNLPILRRYLDEIRPYLDRAHQEDPDLVLCHMPYSEFIEDIYRLIDNMGHGSSRITEIVSELKDYVGSSQVEAPKPGDLESVINSVMTLVGKQVRKMVKTLEVTVAPDLPPVTMHAGKIEQVLINLLINAGQAADKEDSHVRLSARRGTPGTVCLVVEDNGSGIPEALKNQIFDPFFTTKGREQGTGLGLAISHRIIEDHGGSITVDGTQGEGTRFTIVLPIQTLPLPA